MSQPDPQWTRREALTVMSAAALTPGLAAAPAGREPWYATMRRCGQTNFNERDPIELDINWWVDYWSSLKLDALLLNAGGIMAFYPTRIPYHHKSKFLGNRDLFGDFTKAAKARGIRVVARLDCNYVYEEAYRARPEWVERDAAGQPVKNPESPWLYRTCMYSSYFTEQMPAIIREVNSLYDVDGFFTNGWPSTNRPPRCHCEACRALADASTPEGHQQHLERVLQIWKLWDDTARQKKWDSVYVGNLGGGIRAVLDLNRVASVAGWFNADHQGRAGVTPIWDCAQQGRVARAVMKGRTITNVTGSYANTRPLWRHTSKTPLEATLWMAQTTASGMTPWYHWLGGKPEDHRWEKTGRDFFQWIAAHERHFVNQHSLANLAVVFSQRTNAFYRPPGGGDVTEFLQGAYNALLDGRFCFDFVHEDDLGAATLSRYKALILPNAALLGDAQCRQLEDYVRQGGSLLATFETACYDQNGAPRAESGLASLFGIARAGERVGPNGNAAYARIERDHPLLQGFHDTRLLPFAEYYLPLRAVSNPILTVLPPFPAFPPEMVYPSVDHTDQPAVVLAERGAGRLVYIPGDTDRAYWRSQNPDLSRLITNAIRWMLREESPVSVTGEGMAEIFAWKTEPGFAVHILNYSNPDMQRGWFTRAYPLGPQRVRLKLPAGARVSNVELLRAGAKVPFTHTNGALEFAIPRVVDYEVAALT
ncbi:MAG TPA: alpha-amylase family protein [Bryobacteraceae bacterium]|nr:alpha-amylase family protein [Bryobacteraceae bacterium]